MCKGEAMTSRKVLSFKREWHIRVGSVSGDAHFLCNKTPPGPDGPAVLLFVWLKV